MRAPFTLNESRALNEPGDLNIFESLDALLGYVEPIDVEHGEYFAFDADGRLLSLTTDGREIFAAEAEAEPTHSADLARLLRAKLATARHPDGGPAATTDWCEAATLEQLVARASDIGRAWRASERGGVGTRLLESARRWFAPG